MRRRSGVRTAPRPTRRAAMLAAATAFALAASVLPVPAAWSAPAQGDVPPAGASGDAPYPPAGEGLSPPVAALPLVSDELDRAERELQRVQDQRGRDVERLTRIGVELESLGARARALRGLVDRRGAQLAKARGAHRVAREALRGVAVEWFITGFGALDGLDPALTADQRELLAHQYVLSESAALEALGDEQVLARRVADLRAQHRDLSAQLADVEGVVAGLERERDERVASVQEAEVLLPQLERRVVEEQMAARVEGTDLSATALDAYWRAEKGLSLLAAGCGVQWWVLAGIGRTESHHGTYRGATLAVDGSVDPPIYGPYLDGTFAAFAIVPDSDGGLLDGTATTDRATGPMQFLPSTWRRVGTDGDGDGVADPQNLFDAAISAGVYLCRSGPLDSEDRLRSALLTYNRSLPYVATVLERGRAYREALPLG